MTLNANTIIHHVIKIKNGTMINFNANVKCITRAKMIVAGILAHVFVKTVGI